VAAATTTDATETKERATTAAKAEAILGGAGGRGAETWKATTGEAKAAVAQAVTKEATKALMTTMRDAGGAALAAEKVVTAAVVAAKKTTEREKGGATATVVIGETAEAVATTAKARRATTPVAKMETIEQATGALEARPQEAPVAKAAGFYLPCMGAASSALGSHQWTKGTYIATNVDS